jgi:hypothetical protein
MPSSGCLWEGCKPGVSPSTIGFFVIKFKIGNKKEIYQLLITEIK